MKAFLLSLLLLAFSPAVFWCQEALLRFEHANEFYRAAEYQKAIEAYEGVLAGGYESPALYYNLGNAYFKMQKLPAAILNFERARRLDPRDEDVLYNLRLANLKVIDKIDPVPELFFLSWWKGAVDLRDSGGWAMLTVVGLWMAAAIGALFLLSRSLSLQRIMFFTAVLLVLFSLLACAAMIERLGMEGDDRHAVVFNASVSVKSAPDAQGTDLFILHEGVKVEFLDSVGEWRKIRLPDGKVGWLEADAVRVI